MSESPLRHWLPYKLYYQQQEPLCRWLFAGEKRFTEPFFDETSARCLSHAYNSQRYRVVSHPDVLPLFSRQVESIQPTAFVFHVSRCGSTLLSQLLSLSPANIVLSEVPFLDDLLRLPFRTGVSAPQAETYFKAALALYGQKRFAGEQHLFIKTDSWHILFWVQLRRLYPGVPFVLLYRHPGEVVRSHQKLRGMQAVPGLLEPGLFGLAKEEISHLTQDDYLALVLEKYYDAFLQAAHSDPDAILVNYNEGFDTAIKKVAVKTGLSFSETAWKEMKERAGYHAKHPHQSFSETQGAAPLPDLQKCFFLYEELEACRRQS